MTPQELNHLKLTAVRARQLIIRSIHAAGTGHPGGSLSAIDYLTYLYQSELCVDPSDPENPDRDRFVLSKGHVAPALYAALAQKGFFPETELLTLRQPGSRLQGHPNMNSMKARSGRRLPTLRTTVWIISASPQTSMVCRSTDHPAKS